MMACDYSVKAPVLYGVGAIRQLGERVKGFGAKKPILICDPNLAPEIYDKAADSLKAAGLDYVIFKETKHDAPIEVIDACGELGLREKVDCVVGIGGGSTLDSAKAAAILLSHPGPIKQYILANPIQVTVDVPIILLPTTAGTGSECTKVAVVNRTDLNMKWSVFVSLALYRTGRARPRDRGRYQQQPQPPLPRLRHRRDPQDQPLAAEGFPRRGRSGGARPDVGGCASGRHRL